MEIVDKVKGIVTKKVGPLPVWGWTVVGAAAFYLYRMMKAKEPDPTVQENPGSQGNVFYGTGTGNVPLPMTPPPAMEPAYGSSSYISLPGGYTFEGDVAGLSQLLPLLGGFGSASVGNTQSTSPMAPVVPVYTPPPAPAPGCYAGTNSLGRYVYFANQSDCQMYASGCSPVACL